MPEQAWSSARALATHVRIAEAARQAGFAVARLARGDLDAVARALESFG
jgi:uroporphyrinogen-III synthase